MNYTTAEFSIYIRCGCGKYFEGDSLSSLSKCVCGNFDWKILSEEEHVRIERDKKISQINENNID